MYSCFHCYHRIFKKIDPNPVGPVGYYCSRSSATYWNAHHLTDIMHVRKKAMLLTFRKIHQVTDLLAIITKCCRSREI